MKIAQVVSTFSPHFGGMGMVCEEESDNLAEREHDVTVFTLRYPRVDYSANLFLFEIERLIPYLKFGDAGLVPQLTGRLRDFEIIHLHYPFYGGAEWVWLAKVLYGKKYFVTYHMVASPSGFIKRFIKKIYDWFWEARILMGAEKILIVDREYWANLPNAKIIPQEKVFELSNGVNLKIFQPRVIDVIKNEIKEFQDKKIILFVGNLLPLKRLDLLIKALAKIDNDVWRLIIVGGGYAEVEYRRLVKILGLEQKIKFVGYCFDRVRLAEYFSSAWTTVLPTDNESFSLVALESLACGTPVLLSTGSGGANRIAAGETGLLFTPGSVDDLYNKLNQLLNLSAEERKQWGENSRKSALEHDWGKHISKLEKIYATV